MYTLLPKCDATLNLSLKLPLNTFLPFSQVFCSMWSVRQQSFGPIKTVFSLSFPRVKPQSLSESVVCFGNGKGVFLANSC